MSINFIHFIVSIVLLANVKLVHPHPAAVLQAQENQTSSVVSIPSAIQGRTAKENAHVLDSIKAGGHSPAGVPMKPLRLRRSIHVPYGKRMSDQPIKDLQAILSGDYKGNKDLLRLLASFVPNDKVYDPYYNDDEDVIDLVYYGKKPGQLEGVSKPVQATPLSDTISLMRSGIGSPLAMPLDDGESEDALPLQSNKLTIKHTNPFVTSNSAFSKRSHSRNHSPERIQFLILPDGRLALILRGPDDNNRYILLSLPQHFFSDGIPVIQRAVL